MRYQSVMLALVLATAADAQVHVLGPAGALLRIGDDAVGATPGETIAALSRARFLNGTDWAVLAGNRVGSTPTINDEIVGALSGGPVEVLRRENTFSTALGDFDRGPDGALLYNAPFGALDQLWHDDTRLIKSGDAVPGVPGKFLTATFAPDVDDAGRIIYAANLSEAPFGINSTSAILRGDGSAIFKGGDAIGGLAVPATTGTSTVIGLRVSRGGTHWMTRTQALVDGRLETLPIINGAAIAIDGQFLHTRAPIQAVLDTRGETWGGFEDFDVNESGSYVLSGRTQTGDGEDGVSFDFLLKDGEVLLEDDDAIATPLGTGTIAEIGGAVELNNAGDWLALAGVWIAGAPHTAVLVNGTPVLLTGEAIDWDGDGALGLGDGVLTALRGATLSERDPSGNARLLLSGDALVNGTTNSGLMSLLVRVPEPATIVLLTLAGILVRRRR